MIVLLLYIVFLLTLFFVMWLKIEKVIDDDE